MTAKPGYQPIYIYRGDPWSMWVGSEVDGVAEPVTASDVLAQIRATFDATEPLVELTAVDEGTGVLLSLTAAQTAALSAGSFVWDFQPATDGETWLRGTVTVDPDVSRVA